MKSLNLILVLIIFGFIALGCSSDGAAYVNGPIKQSPANSLQSSSNRNKSNGVQNGIVIDNTNKGSIESPVAKPPTPKPTLIPTVTQSSQTFDPDDPPPAKLSPTPEK